MWLIFKKHAVLLGISTSLLLLFVATRVYPGGSFFDKNSVGFSWTQNFISNLFEARALNGMDNPSRIWADAGMIFLAGSLTLFFARFSERIPSTAAGKVIKYVGMAGMLCTILIVTPLHGIMVIIASTLFLISMFYITVFVFRSRLHLLKLLCVIGLLIFYYTLFMYGSGKYEPLPILQKTAVGSMIILILILEYFTKKGDLS